LLCLLCLLWLSSPKVHIIAQFVFIRCRVVRKVGRKLFTNFLDSPHETGREIGISKSFRNDRGHAIPEFLSNALVNSAIAQNNELSTRWDDKEEHAIPIFCLCDAHPQ